MPINFIDILLFLTFVAIVCLGFIGGTIRLFMVLIALYLGVVVAGYFYMPVAWAFSVRMPALELYSAQVLAFFLLVTLGTAALALSLIKTFHSVKLPNFVAGLDQIGGAGLGTMVATFSVVLATIVLRAIFSGILGAANMGLDVWPGLIGLAVQTQTSFLARLFADLSAPIFVVILPWFPNGLPEILVLR